MESLVKMLKETTPVIWDAAVRQIYINGIISIIGGVILLIIAGVSFHFSVRNEGEITDSETGFFIISVIFGLFGFVFVILGIMYLANPEYWAFKSLLP